ncbi:MAG TPA: hypothetical protein PKL92_05920 [Aquaticitalea sp.]|nr:hypothetical protein [Aquaticitalea sp.]
MKKLLLSLAALVFVTVLFSQQNNKIAKDKISQETAQKVDKVFRA